MLSCKFFQYWNSCGVITWLDSFLSNIKDSFNKKKSIITLDVLLLDQQEIRVDVFPDIFTVSEMFNLLADKAFNLCISHSFTDTDYPL